MNNNFNYRFRGRPKNLGGYIKIKEGGKIAYRKILKQDHINKDWEKLPTKEFEKDELIPYQRICTTLPNGEIGFIIHDTKRQTPSGIMRVLVAIPMSEAEIHKSKDGGFEDFLLGKENTKKADAQEEKPKKTKDYTIVFAIAVLATFAIVIYATNKSTK